MVRREVLLWRNKFSLENIWSHHLCVCTYM
jgi:hypothetical protein